MQCGERVMFRAVRRVPIDVGGGVLVSGIGVSAVSWSGVS